MQMTSSFSLTYYTPWSTIKPAFRFSYQGIPNPRISLSFPRVLPPDGDIFVHIRAGRIEEVKSLLIQGRASVFDIASPYGLSTISLAYYYKKMDIYKLLITAGGNICCPSYRDTSGSSQFDFWMNFSSRDFQISVAEILQDDIHQTACTVDPEHFDGLHLYHAVDYDSFTRLHKCILGLTSEVLETILPAVSCIDEVDFLGRTALHLAAYKTDLQAITLLLTFGAELEIRDKTGNTPLQIATALDSMACTEALAASGADIQARDKSGNTPLHNACKLGYLRVVKLLLERGAGVEDTNYCGETPLMHANFGGHLAVIRLLLHMGANLHHRDKLGYTVIHDAVQCNLHEVLRFHLAMAMRVDQKLENGKGILHLLAEEADRTTLQIFLDSASNGFGNLNGDDRDRRGYTAMEYLACRRDVAEVSELFQHVLQRVEGCSQDLGEADEYDVFWDAVESNP